MNQLELDGYLKGLVCGGVSRLCFVSVDGEGFDAETIEELLTGAGITDLSELNGKDIEIAINIK